MAGTAISMAWVTSPANCTPGSGAFACRLNVILHALHVVAVILAIVLAVAVLIAIGVYRKRNAGRGDVL